MKIQGIAAVVTGGASGLGEATARELAKRGAKVAVFDRDTDKARRSPAEIGGIFCEVDVTSDEKVAGRLCRSAVRRTGQERVLVNLRRRRQCRQDRRPRQGNQGAEVYPMIQFELAIQINLIGSFRCIAHSAVRHGQSRSARGR
jgi:NAD(P)-dependent dehydrogenase (short-subunit alcohol dehydrogenase family)